MNLHAISLGFIALALIVRHYFSWRLLKERQHERVLSRRFWAAHEKRMEIVRAGGHVDEKLTYENMDKWP